MLTASERLAEFERDGEIDFSHTVRGLARFRVNAFRQRGSISIACRVVPFDDPLERRARPARRWSTSLADEERGLILVTGTTGSGKSTTLAAMVDHINRTYAKNIVTIEDPIEYLHKDKTSVVHQREIGFDTTVLLPGAAAGAAPGPGRDPDRGDARRGDGRHRAQRGRDRPPRAQHAAHDRRGRDASTGSSTSSRRITTSRSARCSPARCGA